MQSGHGLLGDSIQFVYQTLGPGLTNLAPCGVLIIIGASGCALGGSTSVFTVPFRQRGKDTAGVTINEACKVTAFLERSRKFHREARVPTKRRPSMNSLPGLNVDSSMLSE